ncbi:APG6-domain-containing protein [Thelephora terrestris]|uniref:APG6-domain-containing protein n=1 Tax=Thelephora terrestris TaxID=56493 RepID=A0A9P6LD81_9AGAM|nr:APG6-domain-containing protein [Thelephora terrestris]
MAFVCQQCKQPLQLDASLVDLTPSAWDMIAASLPPSRTSSTLTTDAERLSRIPSTSAAKAAWQRSAHASSLSSRPSTTTLHEPAKHLHREQLPSESFVLLQDSIVRHTPTSHTTTGKGSLPIKTNEPQADDSSFHKPTPISQHIRSTQRLMNLISSRTDVDHPLCAECTHLLLTALTKQLDETKKERDGYIAFEKEVRKEKEREKDGLTQQEAEKRIEKLAQEEKLTINQLKEAEKEREQLEAELKALELEEKALEEEEAEFWRAYNSQQLRASEQTSQLAAIRTAYAADSATLEKLERTNVYNDAFCIGHDGVFGTINGLRLGRVPGVPVEWAEINAAWGQTLLLLYTVARKLDFSFENWTLVPMGSFSRIERINGDKASLELHGSGDLHLGRILHNRRFDHAMVAFLDCLRQTLEFVKAQDPTVDFPHQIVKDKIGDVSVKVQFSQEEAWTRALRHVLLALKLLLKWTTNGNNG